MAQRKDRYGFNMDFLSMVPPAVEIQQARVPPGSTYIEFVERQMELPRSFLAEDKAMPPNSILHSEHRRRLKLRVCSLGTSWAMDRRYSISFAYDAITHTIHVAAVYLNGGLMQGVPPLCDDREYRELCALYLEEELYDRVVAARQAAVRDFLMEVNAEKYLRQHLAGK